MPVRHIARSPDRSQRAAAGSGRSNHAQTSSPQTGSTSPIVLSRRTPPCLDRVAILPDAPVGESVSRTVDKDDNRPMAGSQPTPDFPITYRLTDSPPSRLPARIDTPTRPIY